MFPIEQGAWSADAISTLADVSVKAAILALVVWVLLKLLRVQSAAVKHRAATLILIGMMIMPGLIWISPRIEVPVLASDATVAIVTETNGLAEEVQKSPPHSRQEMRDELVSDNLMTSRYPIPHVQDVRGEGSVMSKPHTRQRDLKRQDLKQQDLQRQGSRKEGVQKLGWAPIALCVYLSGVAMMLLSLSIGCLHCWLIVRRARMIDEHDLPERPNYSVFESSRVRVPASIGLWSPKIVLPLDWRGWDDSLIEMAIAHESQHIRRRDTWVGFLSLVNRAVYWFHPLAWILRRRLADLAEHVCDDAVIETTGRRHDYADNLVEMASRVHREAIMPMGVGMARGPFVQTRVERIIDAARPLATSTSGRVASVLAIGIATAAIFIASLSATAQSPAPAPNALNPNQQKPDAQSPDATVNHNAEGAISGKVILPNDEPAKSATVFLSTRVDGQRRPVVTRTKTNDRGEFRFDNPPAGTHRLVATTDQMASRTEMGKSTEVSPDEKDLELKLSPAPSIHVTAASKSDGKPIADALVRLSWSDFGGEFRTDQRGEVTIGGLTRRGWSFEVRAPGFAEQKHTVDLSKNEFARIKSSLDPGANLSGTITDQNGKPIPGIGISVFPGDRSGGQIEFTRTDENGVYFVDSLPLIGLRVSIYDVEYQRVTHNVSLTVPAGKTQKLDLQLKPRLDAGSIHGIVVDKDGNPIEGAHIENHGSSSNHVRAADTNEEGEFKLTKLFRADELVVQAKGYAPRQVSIAGKITDPPSEIKITLQPGHFVKGRTVNENGDPIPGVSITSDGRSGSGWRIWRNVKSDADGSFFYDSLPPGAVLDFYKRGYSRMDDRELPLDGEDVVDVVMTEQGILRGRVVDRATGKPIPVFKVKIGFSPDRKPGEPSSGLSGARVFEGESFSNVTGRFELADFVQGMPLQVTVTAEGYERTIVRRVMAMKESESAAKVYELEPINTSDAFNVRGKIVDKNGNGIKGIELRLITTKTSRGFPRDRFPFNWQMIENGQVADQSMISQFFKTTSDDDGSFEFKGVRPAKDIEIAYWGDGVSRDRVTGLHNLSTDKLRDFKISAVAGGIVRGKIDTKGVPGISRIALSGQTGFYYATLAQGGSSYEVRDVPQGDYELQVYGTPRRKNDGDGNFRTQVLRRIKCTVKSGEVLELDVEAVQPPAPPAQKPSAEDNASHPMKLIEKLKNSEPTIRTEDFEITGRVIDENGEGIQGAAIWMSGPPNGNDMESLSKANGSFSLIVPAEWSDPKAKVAMYTLWIHSDDHRLETASAFTQIKRGDDSPIEVTLRPPTGTQFIVKDPLGNPVHGARVEPHHYYAGGGYALVPDSIAKRIGDTTDTEGVALLNSIDRNGFHTVRVSSREYGTQLLRLPGRPEDPVSRTITLRSTGGLQGQFVAESRDVLRDMKGYVYQSDFGGKHTYAYAMIEIDDDGKFEIPALAEGEIRLVFRVADAAGTVRPKIPDPLVISAGETTQIEIPFVETVLVRGRVQTKSGKKGVEGARISVRHGAFRQSETVYTDENGDYTARVLPGEVRQQLIVRPWPYQSWVVENAGWQRAVNIPDGTESFRMPTLELIETHRRSGRLVDKDSRPLAGYSIWATKGNRRYAFGRTNSKGEFSLSLPKDFEEDSYGVSHREKGIHTKAKVLTEKPLVLWIE